ncbi:hypothetical protein JCM5296_001426 [Sporobolomyces johnsonii]
MPSAILSPTPVKFDPAVHLNYQPPKSRTTMKDLALEGRGISPVAVTEPFPLFSLEGVTELRREILSQEVLDKYTVSSHLAALQAREFPESVTPFVYAAWKSPEMIAAVSAAAGIDLVPAHPCAALPFVSCLRLTLSSISMDLELGHTNFQVGGQGIEGIRSTSVYPQPQSPFFEGEELENIKAKAAADDGMGADGSIAFHHDSYPFVAVVMLSDCQNMVGGETAIKTGDGRIVKARGPSIGSAVVMQGRYLSHAGLKAYNVHERIAMVTSFRPRDPLLEDSSVLSTIRYISKKNRLNYQWSVYRFKLLSERFATMAAQLEAKKAALGPEDDEDGRGGGEVVNVEEMSEWLDQQVAYLNLTKDEYHK